MKQQSSFNINEKRLKRDIDLMATFTDQSKPGWTRRSFSKQYNEGRKWIREQMDECGMETEVDAASNLIGRIKGSNPNLAPIMIGSHTDTVTGGGRFDGIIGVLIGLEIGRRLKETDTVLEHTLEIIDFTAEEVSEFGVSMIGSRGLVDNLPVDMLERTNELGATLEDAIKNLGGNPKLISERSRKKGDISLYLEIHIEQGPILDKTNKDLAVVTGIVGIQRYRVTVEGKPNHAGTTPMDMRQDALTGAAEMVQLLEEIFNKKYNDSLVGTVGVFDVKPNGANVVPGKVIFDLEVRSLNTELLDKLMHEFANEITIIGHTRSLTVEMECLSTTDSVHVNQEVQDLLEEACVPLGQTVFIPSGAGHDGTQLANIAPIGMIFVPSKNGISHSPDEWTDFNNIALGAQALGKVVLLADKKLGK